MEGVVYKSTGSWYSVKDREGNFWNGRVKGRLKIDEDISSTNPIAVGDHVTFIPEQETGRSCIIAGIRDRDNYIVRVSPHNKNQKHIIAANLSQALLVVSIAEPRTATGFIDRFLITAEAYHIPALLVINKVDLLRQKQLPVLEKWKAIYGDAGYDVYAVSAKSPETLAGLKEKLADKITLFSGHSGVGKSTLINHLLPGMEQRTKEVSGWSGKGQHTTTFAEMFDLPGGGSIIDTPGVKEFGLIDFSREELSQYFTEIRAVMAGCRFNNCLHMNEPDCAVKKAVAAGLVSEERYFSYLSILESIETKW